MTLTMYSIRRGAALGVLTASLAAVVLGTGSPRTAEGHAEITEEEALSLAEGETLSPDSIPRIHPPEAPRNLRVEGAAGSTHNAVVVTWEAGHDHDERLVRARRFGYANFRVSLSTSPLPMTIGRDNRCLSHRIPHCIRWTVAAGRASYSETVTGLMPETAYYVHVAAMHDAGALGFIPSHGATATIITTAVPETPDPDTPTTPDPEPPGPETPDPETPTCTYKHRLIGVPGSTANGYTSQILISSEEPNATATIRAYQKDNGAPIDVLDSEGRAVGSSTSLAPAHSVKRFRLEEIRGWHNVIVEHPTKAAMENATVAIRIREPDVGVQVEHVQGIEHCTTAATTTE